MKNYFYKSGRGALICLMILLIWTEAMPAGAVETGPVERKWGLGWANGLTARLWLGGVWELALTAGPDDYLSQDESHLQDTGYPPYWEAGEVLNNNEQKRESGFVELQAGRLLARRGPVAAVGFLGLNYNWSHSHQSRHEIDINDPEYSYLWGVANDVSIWTLTLGFRPSVQILDHLTLETAFWLGYRWYAEDHTEWRDYTDTGQYVREVISRDVERFYDGGWDGMGSLQIIFWF